MTEERAIEAAKSAMGRVRRLVAAYEVDYDLLTDLRDERDDHAGGPAAWAIENPDDAAALADLERAADGLESADDALARIEEDPISVQVRSGWADPGEPLEPAEYQILLATGGPGARIVGVLDQHGEPASAYVEGRDWGTPWIRISSSQDDERILIAYAACFFLGE